MVDKITLKGECIGVKLETRPDGHILFQLLVEDDGSWFPLDNSVSSHWLDEAIRVLMLARTTLREDGDFEKRQYGYYQKVECTPAGKGAK